MFTVFVAGGIGSGKSTVAKRIARLGGQRIDLDQIARDIVEPGSEVLVAIAQCFGSDVLDPEDGSLRREVLAARAFATPEATSNLNAITHPAIKAELKRRIDHYAAWGYPPQVCIIEIPLLDQGMDLVPMADEVLVVDTSDELRRERAIERGVAPDDYDRRVAQQPSRAFLMEHADCRICNDGSPDELAGKVDRWWERHMRRGWTPSEGECI